MPSDPPPIRPVASRARAPLGWTLAFTWVNSLAASALTVGIFFVVQKAYGFTEGDNLRLGLLMGVCYIPGAVGVGPGLRRLADRLPWLSTRGALAFLVLTLAAIAAAPALAHGARWIIWPAVGAHLLLSGALWPIVESYMSGGRSGRDLRTSAARFNVCWSSASFAVMWLAAPLLAGDPLRVLLVAAALHAASCLLLPLLPQEPGKHVHEEHAPHPPVYTRLLVVFRWLLPTGYVLAYCLSPLMPSLVARVGLGDAKFRFAGLEWAVGAVIASAWLFSRIGTFSLFALWHGWHGRWATAVVTGATMVAGFALAVTAGSLEALLAGLVLFGLGLGGVYAAALYYVLEVGKAEVDAGGSHEALIGLGYTLGPLAGLAGLEGAKRIGGDVWTAPRLTAVITGALCALALTGALWQSLRTGRRNDRAPVG